MVLFGGEESTTRFKRSTAVALPLVLGRSGELASLLTHRTISYIGYSQLEPVGGSEDTSMGQRTAAPAGLLLSSV